MSLHNIISHLTGSNASAAAASSDGEATQALNQEDGEEDEMPSTSGKCS